MRQRTYPRNLLRYGLGLVALTVPSLAAWRPAHAELPPDAYRHMQQAAPEVEVIKVLALKTRPVRNGVAVDMVARIVMVKRSKTKLRAGQLIHIDYFHRTTMLIGPGAVPLLTVGQTYPAFLAPVKGQRFYTAAAGDCSFLLLN